MVWLDRDGNLSATNWRGMPLGPSVIKRGCSVFQATRLTNILMGRGIKVRLKTPHDGVSGLGLKSVNMTHADEE